MNLRRALALAVWWAAAPAAFAAPVTYIIDPNVTTPEFQVGHVGFTSLLGHFDKATGTVKIDLAAHTGSVDLTIDTTSIHMGSGAWSAHLRDEELFDVAHYPTMTYRSTRLIFQEDQVVGAEGELTLRGVTRPVFVDVTHFRCGTNPIDKRQICAGDVRATIKRSEFGMTRYLTEVSDEVEVRVPVEAYRE